MLYVTDDFYVKYVNVRSKNILSRRRGVHVHLPAGLRDLLGEADGGRGQGDRPASGAGIGILPTIGLRIHPVGSVL